jgi:hypothetical protein
VVVVYLEPSVVAQVATESFQLDSTRMVVPPFYSPEAPELRSVILSLYSELRIGSGVQLLVHSLANILAVHLIPHITGTGQRLPERGAAHFRARNSERLSNTSWKTSSAV